MTVTTTEAVLEANNEESTLVDETVEQTNDDADQAESTEDAEALAAALRLKKPPSKHKKKFQQWKRLQQ